MPKTHQRTALGLWLNVVLSSLRSEEAWTLGTVKLTPHSPLIAGAGIEEELMRYRHRQLLKALLLCFLFSLVVTAWIYVLYNAPP